MTSCNSCKYELKEITDRMDSQFATWISSGYLPEPYASSTLRRMNNIKELIGFDNAGTAKQLVEMLASSLDRAQNRNQSNDYSVIKNDMLKLYTMLSYIEEQHENTITNTGVPDSNESTGYTSMPKEKEGE